MVFRKLELVLLQFLFKLVLNSVVCNSFLFLFFADEEPEHQS